MLLLDGMYVVGHEQPDHPRFQQAKAPGFSLHAGVTAVVHERQKLEQLSLTSRGWVRYRSRRRTAALSTRIR